MDEVRQMTAVARRVDRISATQVKWGDLLASMSLVIHSADPNEEVWVVAVVGDIHSGGGPAQCGRWVFDTAGRGKMQTAGALKMCEPYFPFSLVPPAEPVRCPPEPVAYAFRHGQPIPSGPVPLTIQRDDGWRMPTSASATFLYEYGSSGIPYYGTFCRPVNVPIVRSRLETAMLDALGSPNVSGSTTTGGEIWLKGYHAISATATADHVNVLVEPRAGFEVASFDWRALAPQGGYVRFELRDRAGVEITFTVANGP